MNILIFNSLYYPNQIGGAEKSVQLLAENLANKGNHVYVVTTSNIERTEKINNVTIYYIKTKNLYWLFNAKKESFIKKPLWHLIDSYNPFYTNLIQLILDIAPDIIHTNNIQGLSVYIWKIANKLNIPIVHTLRDYYLLCYKNSMFNNNKNCNKQCSLCKLYSIPKKKLSNSVNAVVGISDFILNRHLQFNFFSDNKIKETIYNSITFPNIDTKENIENNIKTLGFVGKLSKHKGVEFLLDEFIKLDNPNLKLKLFGKADTTEYENYLKEKYNQKNINFMGFVQPNQIYTQIDYLIVPSLWNEPFGRIVAEANSYNIPVLCSNLGGLKELVIDGENGYIFNPNIKNDFNNKLNMLISTNFKNIKRVLNNKTNIETVTNRYLTLYQQVIDENK